VSPFALLLLAGAFHDINVVDQTYQIPAGNWRYIDSEDWHFPEPEWRDRSAIIRASYVVESGPPVRLLLMDRASLDSLRHGADAAPLQQTAAAALGVLRHRIGSPADCILVLENRGSPQTATVHLLVTLDSWEASELSPRRKLIVLAVSFGVFFGLVTYSAARLWKVFRT
jgi:hypothetical protein